MKRAAILQSSYIPWKGYFDIINLVDEFILYDDVQYTRRDWRSRNRIKVPGGTCWLTIPVQVKGRFTQKICETEIADRLWAERHWQSIRSFYARAAHFEPVAAVLQNLYERAAHEDLLSRVNELFIRGICGLLGIETRITRSTEYELQGERVERLVGLCRQAGANEYLSGPSARSYLEEEKFSAQGIGVRWMDYSGYPEYRQLFSPPFVHEVSALDLLLNEGPQNARSCLISTRDREVEAGACASPS